MATIWIDLDNAPHVALFTPLVKELERRGNRTLVTVRDYGYTRVMLDDTGIPYTLVGRHPGKHLLKKIAGLATRVLALARWARGRDIDVAVSHGSRGLVMASRLLRVPCVTMYDYEYVSTRVYRFSTRLLVPDIIPDRSLKSLGAEISRVVKYPGMKEEVYLARFEPEPEFLAGLGVTTDNIIVVLRPPATEAHYHNPLSEEVFDAFLERVSRSEQVTGIVLPRTEAQLGSMSRRWKDAPNIRMLDRPVDGLQLLYHADMVVGAGGTMNREAALMGVPVYSVFAGTIGAIDQKLSDKGKLVLIRSVAGVAEVPFARRDRTNLSENNSQRKQRGAEITGFICDQILDTANMSR